MCHAGLVNNSLVTDYDIGVLPSEYQDYLKSMEESLKKHYGVKIETKGENKDITKAWDNIQQSVCMRV
jgi:hypothetical protein